MSRIVAAEYVTADGVMQDPGGVGEIELRGWSNSYWNNELAKRADHLRRVRCRLARHGTRGRRVRQHDERDAEVRGVANPPSLIDQYRLMIFPVVLGQGKRLFLEGSAKKPLRLIDVNTTSTGVLVADYVPAPDARRE
jgi:hypothetical protein